MTKWDLFCQYKFGLIPKKSVKVINHFNRIKKQKLHDHINKLIKSS